MMKTTTYFATDELCNINVVDKIVISMNGYDEQSWASYVSARRVVYEVRRLGGGIRTFDGPTYYALTLDGIDNQGIEFTGVEFMNGCPTVIAMMVDEDQKGFIDEDLADCMFEEFREQVRKWEREHVY